MIDDDHDDFETGASGRKSWRTSVYRWTLLLGGAAALIFGGVYLHYSLGGGTAAPRQGEVPLIRAAKGPVKVRPAEPGGEDVPHKDLGVYEKFDEARLKRLPGKPSEDLLAPGDPRPAASRNPVAKGPVCHPAPTLLAETRRYRLTTLKFATAQVAAASLAAAKLAAAKFAGAAPADSRQAAARKPAERKPDRTVRKAAKVAAAAGNAAGRKASAARKPAAADRRASKAGSVRIQLGAFRSRARAANHGRGLQRRHGNLLGRLNMVVERVDLGSKGIFFRLRAGPIANRQTARQLCRTLGKRRVGCFLVRG